MSEFIRGMAALQRRIAASPQLVERIQRRALEDSVDLVARAAAGKARVYRGELRSSMAGRIDGHGRDLKGIVYSRSRHALPFSAGRKKGRKFPPIAAIEAWIVARGITPRLTGRGKARHAIVSDASSVRALAFVIARAIARDGTKPHRFLKAGFRMERKHVDALFRAGLAEIVKGIAR